MNYSKFMVWKVEQKEIQLAAYRNQQKMIEDIDAELDKMEQEQGVDQELDNIDKELKELENLEKELDLEEEKDNKEDNKEAEKKKRQKKELSEEEKEILKKLKEAREAKSKAISILRAISIRIPLLVYGAEKDIEEDITIDNFAGLVDDESWKEFMPNGVTKEKFNEFIGNQIN